MATTKTTKAVTKKAATAKQTAPAKSAPTKTVAAASKPKGALATVTTLQPTAKATKATPVKAASKAAEAAPAVQYVETPKGRRQVKPEFAGPVKVKPEKTRVLAADLRAALMAGLTHTTDDAGDKQYAAVRLAITDQGLLRVNATDKVSAIRVVATGAVSVAGKAFVAVIPAKAIEEELAKPLRAQKDKRVDIWTGPKGGKAHLFVSLDNGKQIAVPLADWTYPNVDKLFDDEPGDCHLNAPIKLDAARIAVFADAVAEFVSADAEVQAPIRMLFHGPDKTLRMEADLGNRAEIVGLLIPIKDKPVKASQPTSADNPEAKAEQGNSAAPPSQAPDKKSNGGTDKPPTATATKPAKAAATKS